MPGRTKDLAKWFWLGVLLSGLTLGAFSAGAMDADCAKFLKTYVNPVTHNVTLVQLRKQPALAPLRTLIEKYSSYFNQPLLAYDQEARQGAWEKIWWGVHEAYALGHQWEVHPLLVLVAAGNLRPAAVSRWMAFLHYARLTANDGHLTPAPTLASIRTLIHQQWPKGKVMQPEEDLADFLAIQRVWITLADYLSRYPAKSLAKVWPALALRQEVLAHLQNVAPVVGLTKPPVVAGLLAQTNHFKNQIRLLRQAARKQDHALLAKRLTALQMAYGISWLAAMDEANLSPRDQQQLWIKAMRGAAGKDRP